MPSDRPPGRTWAASMDAPGKAGYGRGAVLPAPMLVSNQKEDR
jgi:hypothetical protein